MDWQRVQDAMCKGRRFTKTARGYSILADTIMPSGGAVEVFMQSDGDLLVLHDGGASFDELARHGLEAKSLSGARRLAEEINCRLSEDGTFFMDRVAIDQLSVSVAILADLSLRAALFLTGHVAKPRRSNLDVRVRDTLRQRFPGGRQHFVFQGRRRQHAFDFGVVIEGRTVLVEAVTPESATINAAIVKSMDALSAEDGAAWPVLVYDSGDGWDSDKLGLLNYAGGSVMSFDHIGQGNLLEAA